MIKHPLTRADDIHWKHVISDYARELFGIFGSEDARERAKATGYLKTVTNIPCLWR